ncbi:MAG: YggT family protein [Deltaproteobacteria bacterium]|nr:YggT family protein [Deltaproteobacteria bacterium]
MILRETLLAFAQVFNLLIQIYIFIIVARALLSWVNPDPYNPIVRFLYSVTDPVLYRLQRLVPLQFGGIDFTPWVLILALTVIQRIVNGIFMQLASSF